MTEKSNIEQLNWIDPDILAYNDDLSVEYDLNKESEFKEFFQVGWLDPTYDDIRDKWNVLLIDEDPNARLYAKTALWSVHRLRLLRKKL